MKPEVSVIIPTYNRAYALKRAIDSVLAQTEVSLEVIVVDDASTDETGQLLADYEDSRVRYVRMEQNGGPSKARNYGAALSEGDYIAFQDSDDEWYPEKLWKQLQIFRQRETEEIGMVYCNFIKKFPDREVLYPPVNMPAEQKSGYVLDTLLFRPLVGTPTMLIPRSVWEEVGGFAEDMRCFEDWELAMRIASKYQLVQVDEVLVTVYHSTDNLITDSVNAIRGEFYMFREFYKYYNTDEKKKAKLDGIAARVRTPGDFEAYRREIQIATGIKM